MQAIHAFVTYGVKHLGLTNPQFAVERLFSLYQSTPEFYAPVDQPIDTTLMTLLDHAYACQLFEPNTITERDAFEAYLFDFLMPNPEDTKQLFLNLYQQKPDLAFDYLYRISIHSNYIKTKRIAQNVAFSYQSDYGKLQLTINLSKPEKDPKDIAKALTPQFVIKTGPKCLICKENEHRYENARMNLRLVPVILNHRLWHIQYSPYAYFQEHCIVLSDTHTPMRMCHDTFEYLLDFIDFMPSYFIGSNADIPIVGGSILDHDHFQGGKHHFPIENAQSLFTTHIDSVEVTHLKWPLSTIRLTSPHRTNLSNIAKRIMDSWSVYDHRELDILHQTTSLHNTITPIARKVDQAYQIDIILRNNRTSETHPEGIFHPHRDVQHIKKENIGLIEAMGLAILPGRLKQELLDGLDYILHDQWHDSCQIHLPWLNKLKAQKEMHSIEDLYQAVGLKFQSVLEHAGVFKQDTLGQIAMKNFILSLI